MTPRDLAAYTAAAALTGATLAAWLFLWLGRG